MSVQELHGHTHETMGEERELRGYKNKATMMMKMMMCDGERRQYNMPREKLVKRIVMCACAVCTQCSLFISPSDKLIQLEEDEESPGERGDTDKIVSSLHTIMTR